MLRSFINRMTRRRAQLAFFSALSFLCLLATAILTFQVFYKLEEYGSSQSDNITWSLAQIEVDQVKLLSALETLKTPSPEGLSNLRLRYDALYNRINMLQGSQTYQNALRGSNAATRLESLHNQLQGLLPLFDANDRTLFAQRDQIYSTVNAMAPNIRALSIEGLGIDATRSIAEREALTRKLIQLTLLSLLLLTTLLSLLLLLWRLYQLYRSRAIENHSTLERLTMILNTSEDAVIVFRKNGQIVDTNDTARQLFGLGGKIGTAANPPNISDILFQEEKEGHLTPVLGHMLLQTCLAGAKRPTVLTARRHDGHLFPVETSANLASRSNNDVCVCFLHDISDRLAAESEIRAARDKALQGERAKATFLARISHEMRTPLHGIIGSLDLLKKTPLRPDQARYTDVMKSSAQILLGQIDDALGVSRSGGPKLDLSPVPFDLDRLLEDLILSQKPEARARKTELMLTPGSTGFGTVYGDPDRIQQVLLNLISNAIKYTENGQVSLDVSRPNADDDDDNVIEFQIIDTGIGIAQDDMSRIFDDFVRLSHPGQDAVEGSGLGLGIVRNLVTLMGGEIGAESFEGEGSIFWVRLPLPSVPSAENETTDTPSESTKHGRRQNILLVEDNATNRFVLERMLVSDGHTVTLAKCGLDSVAKATAKPYDLIIMDVNMPDIDGIEATRRIRSYLGQDRPPRIVALTAHFSDTDRTAMVAAGIDEVWTKPLKLDDMHALLHELGAQSQTPHVGHETAAEDRPDIVTDALRDLSASVPLPRLKAFVEDFAQESQQLVSAFDVEPPKANDDIAEKLHKLAGSAAVLGAARAQSLLADAEEAARQPDQSDLEQALHALAKVLPVTVKSLQASLSETDNEMKPQNDSDTGIQRQSTARL